MTTWDLYKSMDKTLKSKGRSTSISRGRWSISIWPLTFSLISMILSKSRISRQITIGMDIWLSEMFNRRMMLFKFRESSMKSRTLKSNWKTLKKRWRVWRRSMTKSKIGSICPICTNNVMMTRETSNSSRRRTRSFLLTKRKLSSNWPRKSTREVTICSAMRLRTQSWSSWTMMPRYCGIKLTTCKTNYLRKLKLKRSKFKSSNSCVNSWSNLNKMSRESLIRANASTSWILRM